MGFRELGKFNEVMLAKQIWRLVNDTDSLFYKVFKAKYFPSDNVFEAKVNSGSTAWRSILKARKFIALGAKWRVVNGSSIQIYHDKWLPSEEHGMVVSLPNLLPIDATVGILVDEETMWWNVNIIDQLFLPFEALRIKDIPLCMTP